MQAHPKNKNPAVAGALALVGGPIGFLYVGWRYSLTAAVVFVGLIFVFAFLLPVPSWLIYVTLPVFAFMAHRTCVRLNALADQGQDRGARASNTLPVAIFAMTSMLPLLAGVLSGVMGVATAVPALMGGDVSGGLFMLLLVTPIFVLVNFVGFVLVATLINRAVVKFAPGAPTHVFPPVLALGEKT